MELENREMWSGRDIDAIARCHKAAATDGPLSQGHPAKSARTIGQRSLVPRSEVRRLDQCV